jgi:hypothetical protein
LLASASIGWFFEENPSDKIFFWSLFWWIQISLASLSTLFLICKRNAQSSTWHTSTACVALFFSFYLWTGDYPWVQMIAAWIGFLFIASPRATHKPIRQATYFLWLILAILGTSTFYFWKTYYPN